MTLRFEGYHIFSWDLLNTFILPLQVLEAERCPALDMSCKVEVSWFFVVFGLRRNLKLEWNRRKGASEKVQKNSLCLIENSLKDLQNTLWQISCWAGSVCCLHHVSVCSSDVVHNDSFMCRTLRHCSNRRFSWSFTKLLLHPLQGTALSEK